MRCFYTSDIHGNPWLYERLFALAEEEKPGAILLGGDLSPLTPPLEVMIENQGRFWIETLRPLAARFRDGGGRVILIPGNDDLRIHDEILEAIGDEGTWELVDGWNARLDGFRVVGSSRISLSPFILKDREMYDVEPGVWREPDAIDLTDANALTSIEREPEELSQTLWRELDHALSMVPEGEPIILMAHQPPYDTAIDVLHDGRKIGSEAVRRVIETFKPALGLHGHIHESPKMPGGSWRDRIGDTPVVNPGSTHHNDEKATLHLVSFDTEAIAESLDYRRL